MGRKTRYAVWSTFPFRMDDTGAREPVRRQMHPAFQTTARRKKKDMWFLRKNRGKLL